MNSVATQSMPSRDTTSLGDKEIREKELLMDRPPLILIVDDDATQRMVVRGSLEAAGFQCEEAEDGDVGLEKCMALKPDLVILDVMMPGRDGYSVCSEVRQDPKIHATPVLMMTGLDDLKSIERAFEVGATNFLTKPINLQLLPYHIKYMLRSSAYEQETREAIRLAEESSAAKSQFLASMSHELRTPLNAVLGFSEIIHQEILGEVGNTQYREYAKDIHDSASHLLTVINDILDISKIESGEIQLHEDVCSLQELVERVVRITRPLANEAGLQFEVQLASDLPLLWTDEVRLKQVLINLLSNAIKFTPAAGRVTLMAEVTDEQELIMSISDTGIGIPSDKIEKVLSPFVQVDSNLNRKYEGTGLGLPLAKTLTQHLGGTFALERQEGKGTRATLTFPKSLLSNDFPLKTCKIAS